LVDSRQRGRGNPVEGAIESIVLRYGVTIELREATQREPVIDALAQFAVVPVFDAHENQRAQDLGRRDAVAAAGRLFQTAFQIFAHLLDQGRMFIQEAGDPLQGGVEMDTLILQLEIGETELRRQPPAHLCFSARSSSRLISQMRSKDCLSVW
jgi:hypothetical protein